MRKLGLRAMHRRLVVALIWVIPDPRIGRALAEADSTLSGTPG